MSKRNEQNDVIDDSVIIDNGRAHKRTETKWGKVFKWWPLYVYILFMIAIFVFIASGDKELPYKASYKNGTSIVVVGDTDYKILSVEDKEEYIGSYVSTKLNAVKKEQVARIKSYLLYVSSYYSIVGDDNMDYLIDGKYNTYVKADLYEEKKAYYDNYDNITSYKITSGRKDNDSMVELSNDFIDKMLDIKEKEVFINNLAVTENYETRREIYGFYENGLFSRACYELFKYEGDIYLTTNMIDKKKNNGESVLKGVKLPDELKKQVESLWK